MNVLNEAAKTVNASWCTGDLIREEASKEAGNSYCAVGALMENFAKVQGLAWTDSMDNVGTPENVAKYNKASKESEAGFNKFFHETGDFDAALEKFPHSKATDFDLTDTYEFIDETPEAKVLAKVIRENYPEIKNSEAASTVIVSFNDDYAEDRSEVVAMMEKAALELGE